MCVDSALATPCDYKLEIEGASFLPSCVFILLVLPPLPSAFPPFPSPLIAMMPYYDGGDPHLCTCTTMTRSLFGQWFCAHFIGNEKITYYEINSIYGHDTFLLDLNNVGAAVKVLWI